MLLSNSTGTVQANTTFAFPLFFCRQFSSAWRQLQRISKAFSWCCYFHHSYRPISKERLLIQVVIQRAHLNLPSHQYPIAPLQWNHFLDWGLSTSYTSLTPLPYSSFISTFIQAFIRHWCSVHDRFSETIKYTLMQLRAIRVLHHNHELRTAKRLRQEQNSRLKMGQKAEKSGIRTGLS